MVKHILALVAVMLAARFAAAQSAKPEDNWPQWRGPAASGVAPAADPPVQWSQTSNIRWKVRIPGNGASTPIVWQDKVFIQTAVATDRKGPAPAGAQAEVPAGMKGMMASRPDTIHQFVIMCLDRQSGKVLWEKVAAEAVPHEAHHRDHGYASHSPATDGKRVIAYFGSRGMHCYDMDGNLKWKKDLGLVRTKMTFGEGSSPAIFEDKVVVNWDHEGDDFVAAFDLETGRELWRTPRDEATSWATPLILRQGDVAEVTGAPTGKTRSYNLADGKVIWECGGMTANVIPSPVAADGVVYLTSGFRGNALQALRLGGKGDLTGTDSIVWSLAKHTPYVPSALLYGQRLYFFSGNEGVLSCHDARTGKAHYSAQRLADLKGVYASPVGAGGRVYLVGRNGVTVVIKDADTYEVLASNTLEDSFTASPAAAGGELFLRGQQHLYCIAEKP